MRVRGTDDQSAGSGESSARPDGAGDGAGDDAEKLASDHAAEAVSIEGWVDEYGDRLFRHAYLRTGDRCLAEDLVQETFLAAVGAIQGFRRQSSAATWLTGILRFKIADHFRRQTTHSMEGSGAGVTRGDEAELPCTNRSWSIDPSRIAEDREFWEVFGRCLRSLPATLAEAYVLRDIEGESPKNICEMLEISPTNLSMRVRRARLAMRDLLERNWFGGEPSN